jgi:hypothetical protein
MTTIPRAQAPMRSGRLEPERSKSRCRHWRVFDWTPGCVPAWLGYRRRRERGGNPWQSTVRAEQGPRSPAASSRRRPPRRTRVRRSSRRRRGPSRRGASHGFPGARDPPPAVTRSSARPRGAAQPPPVSEETPREPEGNGLRVSVPRLPGDLPESRLFEHGRRATPSGTSGPRPLAASSPYVMSKPNRSSVSETSSTFPPIVAS